MQESFVNERGNTVHCRFIMDGDRYRYDMKHCAGPDWQQYDTDQDAWYFGVWVNIRARKVVTYAEGDETTVTCADDDHLRAELANMAEFYGEPPPACRVLDTETGQVTHYYDERPSL